MNKVTFVLICARPRSRTSQRHEHTPGKRYKLSALALELDIHPALVHACKPFMARKVHDDIALVWGPTGAAVVIHRLAPGVIYLTGIRNFDGPFEDGPMCDFDREIEAHGSLELFLDLRNVERGSRKSRGPWKEWAAKNGKRHRSHVLVRSSVLSMAITVIAMASGTITQSYADEAAFLRELKSKVPRLRALPATPAWVAETLATEAAG